MKQIIKYFILSLLAIILIFLLLSSLYEKNIVNSLNKKRDFVDTKWKELYQGSSDRLELIKKVLLYAKAKSPEGDSLQLLIDNNYKTRNQYKDECSLDFVETEYLLNKRFLLLLKTYEKESTSMGSDVFSIVIKIHENSSHLNKKIIDYNASALDYNKYISTFPNFFYAKSNGFLRKKFFTIKYGTENDDPVGKSKEMPEWAKGIDTL